MAKVSVTPAVTKVIKPETFVLELSRDEAEAVLASVGFNTADGTDFDTGDIYLALRGILGYSTPGESKFVCRVSPQGWSTVIKYRD